MSSHSSQLEMLIGYLRELQTCNGDKGIQEYIKHYEFDKYPMDYEIPVRELFNSYKIYCRDKKLHILYISIASFSRVFRNVYGFKKGTSKRKINTFYINADKIKADKE